MSDELLILALILLVAVAVMQIVLLYWRPVLDFSPIQESFRLLQAACERSERAIREETSANRQELSSLLKQSRDEMAASIRAVGETVNTQLEAARSSTGRKLDEQRAVVDDHLKRLHDGAETNGKQLRQEIESKLLLFTDTIIKGMTGISETQTAQMEGFSTRLTQLTDSTQLRLDAVKLAVEEKLQSIQQDNATQIDKMRQTVDEKLQGALEKRLTESFGQVSARLEAVHKGLGEMQALATGVGDLKKALTNVKTRGIWGEVQLEALLEQVLMPDQYAANFAAKDGGERVEFAVKMPGPGDDEVGLWMPIDAKFPLEDYQRLVEAQEKADPVAAEEAGKQLEARIKQCASDIREKYVNPPKTTAFGILFLPTEGLFAEVLRRRGLEEYVRRECQVVIAGPTNLWAILSGLQMGFRTLAIQRRSSEVWDLLAAVKSEWAQYGELLARVQTKLQQATNVIESVGVRSRAIGRKLKEVQHLPSPDATAILGFDTPVQIEPLEADNT